METVKMSLSKALKVRSRLAGRLTKAQTLVTSYNSMAEGRAHEVDVKAADEERSALVSALTNLKTVIYRANVGIYEEIEQLLEKKGEITYLNSLNTRDGVEPGEFGGNETKYVATIKKADVDRRVRELESQIDVLQDKIDAYNAVADRIEIDKRILNLAS